MVPPVPVSSSWSSNSLHSVSVSSRSMVLLMIFSIQAARAIRRSAATLAQDISSHCELVHRRRPNPTFCDGHHSARAAGHLNHRFALSARTEALDQQTASAQEFCSGEGAGELLIGHGLDTEENI